MASLVTNLCIELCNENNFYHPGQTISGEVVYTLRKQSVNPVNKVTVQLQGRSYCYWLVQAKYARAKMHQS